MKSQQKFRSIKHNAFTEKVNKAAFSSNDGKKIQLINSIERYAYGRKRDLEKTIQKLLILMIL